MTKLVFVIFKKPGTTHEMFLSQWCGERYVSLAKKLPGLRKWVQNRVTSEGQGTPDGIGELWFDNAETMNQARQSKEMAAAFEDAKAFVDPGKTFSVVVTEHLITG